MWPRKKKETEPVRKPVNGPKTLVLGMVKGKKITQTLEEPESDGPVMELRCSWGVANYITNLPATVEDVHRFGHGINVPPRIGSVQSPVKYVNCLHCTEELKGGRVRASNNQPH